MKRKAHFTMDDYGSFSFHPRPKGQEERLSAFAQEDAATIDNEEVVDRYVKAKLEFEAAQDEVTKRLVYLEKKKVSPCCSTCLYYRMGEDECDAQKIANPNGTCNYYRKDEYGV